MSTNWFDKRLKCLMYKFSSLLLVFATIMITGCGPDYVKPAQGSAIIAFGDSLTQGYKLEQQESYPSQLSLILGREIINAGVSGDTTSDARARLRTDVLSKDPRLVIVLLGGNDVLQNLSRDTAFENLEIILDQILQSGAGVLLVGVRGGLHNAEYKRRFEELAKSKNIPYIEDALEGIFGNKSLMLDNVHPNAAGYGILANRIAPIASELLTD